MADTEGRVKNWYESPFCPGGGRIVPGEFKEGDTVACPDCGQAVAVGPDRECDGDACGEIWKHRTQMGPKGFSGLTSGDGQA